MVNNDSDPPPDLPDDPTLLYEGGRPPTSGDRPGRGPGWRRAVRRIGKTLLAILVGFYLLSIVLLGVYRFVQPPTTGVQVQRRVEALLDGREYRKVRHPVPMDALPRHVPRAVVAAEDGRFWDHWGFDVRQIRAAIDEASEGRIRGASTITQQLVKNLFGCACRNPLRKVYEVALTPPAELILGKERILELYLNQVEWADGVYGIEAAARHHYGVGAEDLSRAQAAGLAALLPNPRTRTPANTPVYRAEILRRMGQRGW